MQIVEREIKSKIYIIDIFIQFYLEKDLLNAVIILANLPRDFLEDSILTNKYEKLSIQIPSLIFELLVVTN